MLHATQGPCARISRSEEVPDDWREDEAYRSSTGENPKGSPCGYIMVPELWLRGEFLSLFNYMELRGQKVVMGATETLLANLHGLNERTFRAAR